jgi:hypothetical protein
MMSGNATNQASGITSELPVIRTQSPPLESEAVWIGFAETGVANAILRVASKLGPHHEGCQVLEPKAFEFVYTRNR